MKNHQKVGGALLATAVVALLSAAAGTSAQMTAQVIEDAKAPIFGVPALSPEQCGETIQNSTTEMIIAFSSCLATSSASEKMLESRSTSRCAAPDAPPVAIGPRPCTRANARPVCGLRLASCALRLGPPDCIDAEEY